MATGKELLESLGLEIAKRKYYNAAKVESVIEDYDRRTAALREENAALRATPRPARNQPMFDLGKGLEKSVKGNIFNKD